MNPQTENKIVLVIRKTRLEELVARFNTQAQARFYIERLGADFIDYQQEDQSYKKAVSEAAAALSALGRVHMVERAFLPNFVFGPNDTVVAVGQDGLVANTLKYLAGQPLVGVNPDPLRWDGVLLPFQVRDLGPVIRDVFQNRRGSKSISMAQASLLDGQQLLAVNDFFIGQKTHVSSRYTLVYGKKHERQSSSGIIVSTGLGSTGWLKSVAAGATAINAVITGQNDACPPETKFSWDAEYLVFSVREPFPSRTSGAQMVFGRVDASHPLIVHSEMPENGVIFSDGIESDYLEFGSGMEAQISISATKGHLVV